MIDVIKALLTLPFALAWRILSFVLSLPLQVPAINRFFERLTTRVFRTDTPVAALDRMAKHSLAVSRGETGNWFERFDRDSVDQKQGLLIEDKLLQYAHLVLPPEKFASCYRNDIPEDLVRPIISDGRALNGEPPSVAFGARCLTDEFIGDAWHTAARAAAGAGLITLSLIVGIACTYIWIQFDGAYKAARLGQGDVAAYVPKVDAMTVASQYRDVWSQADVDEINKGVGAIEKSQRTALVVAVMASSIVQSILVLAISIASGLALAWITAQIWFVGTLRGLVKTAVADSVEPLTHTGREALQRWRYRLPEREMQRRAYEDQIRFSTQIDKSPTIEIGTSLAVMHFRGHLLGVPEDTKIRMSILDLLQHMEVLGGSGEGKSRYFFVPVVEQFLQLRKDGYPIAMYITDDKGAIGADIIDAARRVGLSDSDQGIVVIGTNPGDWFVDLLDGLAPLEVADIIKSVASQMGSSGSTDPFWPEAASDVLLQVAVVLQAAENTTIGVRWCEQNGQRLYSLLSILQVSRSDELILQWSDVVCDALESDYTAVAQFDGRALRDSVEYLVKEWAKLAENTKASVALTLRQSLKGFAFKPEITEGFATGYSPTKPQLPVSQLIGNTIKIVNISQIEHGSAGRLVAIMLKTLFFKLARAREQADPASAKRRLNWWFDPRPGHGGDEHAINVFMADEYQSLVTASQDGLSDALAWNVLRSAGVAGILLSQSPAAYRYAVGDQAYSNISNNLRSKIYLRSEDTTLIESAQNLAGKTMRFHSFDWDQSESSVANEREKGVSVDTLAQAVISEDAAFAPFAKLHVPSYADLVELETGWLPTRSYAPQQKDNDFENRRAVYWRQKDQITSVLQHGIQEADALHADDIMTMGRGRAFCMVQRGGSTVVEIVKLGGGK